MRMSFGNAGFDILGIDEITSNRFSLEFMSECIKGRSVSSSENKACPLFSELTGESGANAAIGSGDESCFRMSHVVIG